MPSLGSRRFICGIIAKGKLDEDGTGSEMDTGDFDTILIPSIDKGRYGFDRQKCAHASAKPLEMRQHSRQVFCRLNTFLLRQNCLHLPVMDIRVLFVF